MPINSPGEVDGGAVCLQGSHASIWCLHGMGNTQRQDSSLKWFALYRYECLQCGYHEHNCGCTFQYSFRPAYTFLCHPINVYFPFNYGDPLSHVFTKGKKPLNFTIFFLCVYIYIYICVCVCVCVCVNIYIYIYIYACVCIIYIYIVSIFTINEYICVY